MRPWLVKIGSMHLFLMVLLAFSLLAAPGCTGDDDDSPGDDDTATGDDDTTTGDDDTTTGDDDTTTGDDDTTTGDDDTTTGDDDTGMGDDDTGMGDDDTGMGDDDTMGDDSTPMAGDMDGDGVLDDTDNCPEISNASQDDADTDLIGDACDFCPDFANADGAPCLTSVYAIKDGSMAEGAPVALGGVVVTGVMSSGYFLQVDTTSANYAGPEYSGIFVYASSHTLVQGDAVTVDSATVGSYYDQIQLGDATVTVNASGQTLPAATVVLPADVATGGTSAAAYEGVLVEVADVSVTDVAPEPGPGDYSPTNEFVVADSLRVNDYLYEIAPAPSLGDTFVRLAGILDWRNGNMKMEPRGESDYELTAEAATLASLSPAETTIDQDTTLTMTVSLTRVADAGGVEVALTADPGGFGTLPASVTVLEGDFEVDFDYTAPSFSGAVTISATYGEVTVTSTITVLEAAAGKLVINEVDYDQQDTDDAEFVEIYNGSDSDISLTDIALVMVNGKYDTEYKRVALIDAGDTLAVGQYLVVGAATLAYDPAALFIAFADAENNVQNGGSSPDGIALINVATSEVLDALSYEGSITAAQLDGFANTVSLVEGSEATVEDMNSGIMSLIRDPNGSDRDDAAVDWKATSTLTPGAENIYTVVME